MWNLYGPTETTVWSTAGRVREGERITIGRAVGRTTTYVLSATLEPMPIGVAGELWIGGVGLASGYLERPALTAERFMPSPFGERGGRLYRTGDVVRRLADGQLEHLGRADQQVKVRGHRIELGEIESALGAHPDVAQAVVVALGEGGDRRLVAYVVPSGPAPEWEELRGHLARRLPEYMVPPVFVALSELPLTPSRKVDRRALPAPEVAAPQGESRPPRGPLEEVLAGIWSEVLGIERVGAEDNFFSLGGHSLLATQVASRVRTVFGVELAVRAVFEAPTVEALAGRIESSLAGRPAEGLPPRVPVPHQGLLPLSFAQQRLWFIDQLDPGSSLYNIPVALRVGGPLDAGLLAICLGEVQRRHAVLRTVFAAWEGVPVQVIHPAAPFGLPLVDLSGLPESQREPVAFALAGEEARRPFDLGHGPLLRGVLLRLAGEDHVATLTMHHIASDGWSMGILVREVTALYVAFAERRPSPLPELPVQYADFAVWQHSWLHGEVLESEIAYWRRQLAGLPPLLELPTDRPRPAVRSFRGATRPVRLPAGLTRQMEALARREGATLFMVLLAAFQALLARASGQDDLAVGSPIAGRNRVEIEGLIGFFVNTLVMRGDLAGAPAFREALGRVRETALAAYLHQDVPFEKLVEELAPERSLGHTPVFQVMLVLQNAPVGSLEIRELRLQPVDAEGTTAKFDLSFALGEQGDGLEGSLEYSTDLFDRTTIQRLLTGFETLLGTAVQAPETGLPELPLLSAAERHQLLIELNATGTAYPRDSSLAGLFAQQVACSPAAPAVEFAGEVLSYAELDARSNRLAHHLWALGVAPEVRVGLCLERSTSMVVAALATLKVGGAYVPLDPSYPRERLELMIVDSGLAALITAGDVLPEAGDLGVPVIDLGAEAAAVAARPAWSLEPLSGPDHLAYVMYTSGSTGMPKGIAIPQRAVIRLTCETDYVDLGPGDRIAQASNTSFDAATFEIWGALLHGGTVVGIDREVSLEPARLAAALRDLRIDTLFLTTALFNQMAREEPAAFASLHEVLFGGEAADPQWVRAVLAAGPPRRLLHVYGPTESTTYSSWYRIAGVPAGARTVPIGGPIGHTTIHVVDRTLEPVPLGVNGELVIGGDGLARGYLRRPELTAERFVPDPFGGPGARLYRSGDLARYRADGQMDYLGRCDHQVKIRGFRIEPGEIEAALLGHGEVRSAVVLPRQDPSGGGSLMAYVETARGGVSARELRDLLRGRLPEYMLPSAYVLLESMPLTVNGKLDRKALAALPLERDVRADARAPRTQTEKLVSGIFAEVLELERVGPEADFFELGGHSLLATQVMSRLRQAFGVDLPLRLLFEAPTVAGLAVRLRAALPPGESNGGDDGEAGDTEFEDWGAIPHREPGAALPLSFAQERLWFLDQLTPGSFVYNIPCVLILSGHLDVAALAAAFAAVVRRHEALRTVFHAPAGEPVQVVLPPFAPPLPVIDLTALSEDERAATAERLRQADMTRGFDLTRGPLLRACLLRLAAGGTIGTAARHLLLLNFHHIAFNGWSIRVLTRELSALYDADLSRRASPLPELPIQYADFACWQRARLTGATLERIAGYWRQRLSGVPPLRLPFDRPRPPMQTFNGDSLTLPLPPEVAARVRHLARRQAATPFMIGLAAFAVVLHRASGQGDFAVGTYVANRTRLELEGLIGFFVNSLALRLDFSGNLTFDRLLAQVREVALGAYAYQDLPFEKLVEDLKLPRDLSLPPVFQVVAVQQPAAGLMAPHGLRLELPAAPIDRADVDLTLYLSDPAGDPYTGVLDYNRDLFDAATMARFGHAFERLLAAALATWEEAPPVDELPLLSAAETWQIGGEWSRGLPRPAAESVAGARFVHQLVERHAALRPAAEAVVWPDLENPERLTYGELNARANRLARLLRRHGAGPEVRVALWLPRSADLVISALAVLKAGGCYVPLDATYSGERLAFMAVDAQARMLVTRGEVPDGLGDLGSGSTELRLDDPALMAALAAESDADLPPEETGLDPENLAYVIYTSGSTGRPKGTMIEHRSLLTAYYAYEQAYRLGDVTGHLQMASFSFDVFTGDFIRALGSGARLVLCPREVLLDPERLYGLLRAERVDGAEFVPAVVRALVEYLESAKPADTSLDFMRLLVVSSDAWYAGEVAALARLCGPRTRLIDSYGVTEATIDTTFLPLAAGDGTPCLPVPTAAAVVPIGRPLAGNEAWVLGGIDLLPPRMPGELCIGGAGVARGYLGRPELTAEKFTPHPFATVPGARLYRAGDLARWLPDGSVEFLGRADSQIKVRGFRIEPGEIEAALGAHPRVSQAVVLALASEAGSASRHLVAYVVASASSDFQCDETELRAFLKQRLPDYMVPAVFMPLAALPLTPNGKVDRRALPVPDWSRSASGTPAGSRRQPPRTAVEETLAAIWSKVLQIETVGAIDDFFAIGGHSLLATQVLSRLRSTFGIEMPLRALFEAPVLADLAARIETAQRALLSGVDAPAPRLAPITPVPREGPLPLSFAQQRLWFIDQLEPGSPLYNIPVALGVEGPLDAGVLALCLGEVVRRHEALRTIFGVFEELDGEPVQVIRPASPFVLPLVDLSGLPESRREAVALRLAGEEAGRPFDLARGPLLRGVLLRLNVDSGENGEATAHVAALTMHHIASDGWSMGILVREVVALYSALVEDTEDNAGRPPLPELPVQYADFAVWQHSWLHGELLESEISFWRRQLAGLPPLLELPTDRPRPAAQSYRGATRPVHLPAALTRQVEALARREGATLFMVLLAAFQALLARISGQDDLAVGSPIAGRNRVETEELIGFFVNTLVLRGDLSGEPSFRELLGRVRETALAADLHQDVPFEKLVQELSPERSLAHAPLFQVMFVLQNVPLETLEIQGLRLWLIEGVSTTAKFDLLLGLTEHSGGLVGEVEYATDLFDAATTDRLAGYFERLLDAALATPDLPVAALPLLGAGERQQLLVEWSDTAVSPVQEAACLHELFEAQARRTPEAVALIDGTQEVLYRDLDQAAERLASRLRDYGAGPEVIVGVWLERSAGLVTALLAILKTGAAYLPLDPRQPRRRLDAMLAGARVSIVLSTAGLTAGLPWSGPLVLMDDDLMDTAGSGRPAGRSTPENLAYVLYTSGSTGTPKGVAVTHRSAVELVRWAGGVFSCEELAGVLAATALSFDLSVFELFVPLSQGGTVILAQNALELPSLPARGRVTLVNTVPSAMAELVRAGSLGASIRTVNLAGEPLPRSLADRLYATGTVERVWNLYGPSEDTTYSTALPVERESGEAPGIGRPVAATKAYVLAPGADMEPQPVGVAGELYLGGSGLARGYLHRPDLTAERFIPDPFRAGAGEAGARLYRTGDRVRWRPDGSLDFLGRLDHQVKVRGFRIELGEIEALLSALEGVREAVVTAREDRSGGRGLVAYVVGDVAADALRRSLEERLPDYMVPATFVPLAALPLTPNGKVDRKALPAPEQQSAEESSVVPKTPVEEVLAGIWAEVLGLEQIGADGHFFALGGHSLLATRVTSRLRGAFGVEMPLRTLFEAPVLADFAARVEAALGTWRAGTGQLAPPLAPLAPTLRAGPLPLSFAQQRLWLIDQLEPDSPLYNMPVVLRIEGPLDHAALALCLAECVRRHEALRTVFAVREGSPVQVIQPAAPFALPLVDLSAAPETERESLALALAGEEASRPFALSRGPLLRGVLLQLAAPGETADHVLALTMHHIVSDGWSMGILVREVAALYAALAEDTAGRPSPLPELPVQYADFAVWQRSWLRGEILEGEIAFWRGQLAGLAPLLELPLDRPRPAVQSFRGASRPVRLPAGLTRQMEDLSRRTGATLFMVLLAGFQALLARLSGQDDLAVGSPVAGRNRVEIEGLIGFFVNTLVMRGDLTGQPSFRELLGRVRETALAAYMHQDLPFERLVEELAPERSLAQTPLFQVMLVLQNLPVESLPVHDLRLRPVGEAGTTAKFDLSFSFAEHDGELAGAVEYATDLFDGTTVDRMVACFERLLTGLIEQVDRRVAEVHLLSAAETLQLASWNATARDYPTACIHELFAELAERSADAVAVASGGRELTRRHIGREARRLAHRLRGSGVGPGSVVGLCAESLPEMVVGMLGILEAGGAYMPLDLAYPHERLVFMLEDAGAAVLVAEEHLAGHLPARAGLRVELLRGAAAGEPGEAEPAAAGPRPASFSSPGDPACVIYTSGSTGRPKGVVVPHRAVVRLVRGTDYIELGPDDHVAQGSNSSFDAATFEIWGALLNGSRLVGIERAALLAPGSLTAVLHREGIGVLFLTTAVFNQLAREMPAGLAELRYVLFGGEMVDPAAVRDVLRDGPPAHLLHLYGPTEATTFATWHRVGSVPPGETVPIGQPLANGTAYVLSAELLQQPVGVRGELYLGGDGLAHGYHTRPELTAERFVPDPFGPASGADPGGGSTARETWCGGGPTACWSTSAGWTAK